MDGFKATNTGDIPVPGQFDDLGGWYAYCRAEGLSNTACFTSVEASPSSTC